MRNAIIRLTAGVGLPFTRLWPGYHTIRTLAARAVHSARNLRDVQRPLSFKAWFSLIGCVYLVYSLCYLGTEPTPGNPSLPLGWLGWFDQSNYLAQSRSFADGTWRTAYQYYPPLYPWLGSWFIGFWPAHPYYLIDFAGLTLHVAAVVAIGRHHFGSAVSVVAVVAAAVLFPFITIDQWEVPWTTALSGGLGSTLLLIYYRFSLRSWRLAGVRGWICVALFSLSFGAMAAVRPLDGVVWLPAALIFYLSLLLRHANPFRPDFRLRRSAALIVLIALCGLLVPVLYAAFNLINTGTLEGTYITVQRGSGYHFHGFLRKFISLFFDSGTIYVESDAAIADRFWPIYLAFPLILYYIVSDRHTLRIAAITIAAQYILYTPFGDLLPNGMYRFFNVHYFCWTFPWLILFCLGFIRSLFRATPLRPPPLAVGVVVILSVLCWLVSLRAHPVGDATARALSGHEVDIDLGQPQAVDFIDVFGATAFWPELYLHLDANQMEIDGRPLKIVNEFRLWPTDDGLRIMMPTTIVGRHFVLHMNPKGRITPEILAARAARVAVSLSCRFHNCEMPPPPEPPVPMVNTPLDLNLGSNGNAGPFVRAGWLGGEDWGRWSAAETAHIALKRENDGPLTISAQVRPLLSSQRLNQTISISANGCPIGEAVFTFPNSTPRAIEGKLPAACISQNHAIDIEFTTDSIATPKSIGLGDDIRYLGVGVLEVEIK